MRITCRIECSPNEFRRLCGAPDVSPLIHLWATLADRRLKGQIEALDPGTSADPGTISGTVPFPRD